MFIYAIIKYFLNCMEHYLHPKLPYFLAAKLCSDIKIYKRNQEKLQLNLSILIPISTWDTSMNLW